MSCLAHTRARVHAPVCVGTCMVMPHTFSSGCIRAPTWPLSGGATCVPFNLSDHIVPFAWHPPVTPRLTRDVICTCCWQPSNVFPCPLHTELVVIRHANNYLMFPTIEFSVSFVQHRTCDACDATLHQHAADPHVVPCSATFLCCAVSPSVLCRAIFLCCTVLPVLYRATFCAVQCHLPVLYRATFLCCAVPSICQRPCTSRHY